MATSAERRLRPKEVRRFGSGANIHAIPDLTEIQTRSYEAFLQDDVPPRKAQGPGHRRRAARDLPDRELRQDAASWNTSATSWASRATSRDECRQLRLTYGRPFRVWLRLTKEQPIEEEVYLGDMPIMLGGGEFIINGAERVVVSQLHRSPGVDFVSEMEAGDRKLHSCRIIPERGSWIELNVSKKDTLSVRIDQSGKFSAMTLLRAMDPKYSLNADLIRVLLRDHDREGRRRPQRRQDRRQDRRRRRRLSGRAATGPARSSSRAARRSPRTSPR